MKRVQDLLGRSVYVHRRPVGRIHDLLFDDATWSIVYIVLRTGIGLNRRDKLLCPLSVQVDPTSHTCTLSLSAQQLHQCPDAETDPPIGWQRTAYFAMQNAKWLNQRFARSPIVLNWLTPFARKAAAKLLSPNIPSTRKSCLRSLRDVLGYELITVDGKVGCLNDFMYDNLHWRLTYSIVRPYRRGLRTPPSVVVPATWLVWLNWAFRYAQVNLPASILFRSPDSVTRHRFDDKTARDIMIQYLNWASD